MKDKQRIKLLENKDWLEHHKKCPSCNKWMIMWGKEQEDKIKFPDKEKAFIWRCYCGHKEEHPWIDLSAEDAFKERWERDQRYAKGEIE